MLGLHAPKRYCIDMLEDMETIFVNNHCTLIAFIGISKQTKSYGFHRDVMDVLYVQDQGSLEMGLENDQTILMKPGDGLWIPRGRGHDPKPLSSRCGMSFGVEGDPDPCTYL
jgi:ribosomal protein L16 Arg81 hydroxylase